MNSENKKADYIWKTEKQCENYLKEFRESKGIVCSKCGGKNHVWNELSKKWICKDCGHMTGLTSGTIMHSSHIPLLYWFIAFQMISDNPKISARKIQITLGHKRYQPIWEMVNKIKTSPKIIYDYNFEWLDELDICDLGNDIDISSPSFGDLLSNGILSLAEFKHKLYN